MKKVIVLFLVCFWVYQSTFAMPPGAALSQFYVNWYERNDWTSVEGYYRTAPNDTTVDNRSCYEDLQKCYAGLDQDDYRKVLDLYKEIAEIDDNLSTLYYDLVNQYPWSSKTQIQGIYNNRRNTLISQRRSKTQSLEMFRDKARIQNMETKANQQIAMLQEQEEIKNLIANGDTAYANAQWKDAIEYYSTAIPKFRKYDPNNEIVWKIENAVERARGYLQAEEQKKEAERQRNEAEKARKQQLATTQAKEEAEIAKRNLWEKALVIESLATAIKSKDLFTQEKIKQILQAFKISSDNYTKNIWIYLDYLLK